MNTWVCRIDGQSPGLDAEAQRSAVPRLSKGGLPELDEWEYGGEVVYEGTSAEKWVHVHRVSWLLVLRTATCQLVHTDSISP